MINHKEAEILTYLIKRCPIKPVSMDNFYLLDTGELVKNLPTAIEKDELLQLLTDLSSREAINIRIANMDECVLGVQPKAKVLLDELKEIEETKSIIQSAKEVASTPEIEEEPIKKTKEPKFKNPFIRKDEPKQVVTKVVVDYKRIFWSAFSGALCGGGIIAIIMLIINLSA